MLEFNPLGLNPSCSGPRNMTGKPTMITSTIDEIGNGATQGNGMVSRAVTEMNKNGKLRPFYELAHLYSDRMPLSPFSDPIAFTYKPTTYIPALLHRSGVGLPHLLQFQQITQKFVVEKTVRIEPFAVGAEGFQACAAKFPELGQKVRIERSGL